MINKGKLEEVIKHKISVGMVWLSYQKALESVPDEWLLTALKLPKVPPLVISPIETLMQKWLFPIYTWIWSFNLQVLYQFFLHVACLSWNLKPIRIFFVWFPFSSSSRALKFCLNIIQCVLSQRLLGGIKKFQEIDLIVIKVLQSTILI